MPSAAASVKLTIPAGEASSEGVRGLARLARHFTIIPPAGLTETVTMQVTADGERWVDLADVTADEALTISDLATMDIRLTADAAVAADRTFSVIMA